MSLEIQEITNAAIKSVAVYSYETHKAKWVYHFAAYALGYALAKCGIEVIYGGTNKGPMGKLADGVIAAGGKITGVVATDYFAEELWHAGLTNLIKVKDLDDREKMMRELSDGFVAMPGGVGNKAEFYKELTVSKPKFKPVVLRPAIFFGPNASLKTTKAELKSIDDDKEGLEPAESVLGRCVFADTVADVLRSLHVPQYKIAALVREDPYIDCIITSKKGLLALFERRTHQKNRPSWATGVPERSKRDHWAMTGLLAGSGVVGGLLHSALHGGNPFMAMSGLALPLFWLVTKGMTGRDITPTNVLGDDPMLSQANRDLGTKPQPTHG